jgi:hypothetical protein
MIIIISSFSSCDKLPFVDYFYSLVVENKSTMDVVVNFSNKLYPDTTLSIFKPERTKINSKQGYEFTSMISWDESFKKRKVDTISIYFINSNTLQDQSWDTIRLKYMILERYDLSLKDLQNRNFEIEFPYDSTRGKLKVYRK